MTTTIRVSDEVKEYIKENGNGSSINEKLKFLLDMDSLSKTFLTKPEIEKLIDKKIQEYANY